MLKTDSIVLVLAGGEGFRLTVADEGGWYDILVPDGKYLVSVSGADGLVSAVQLHGPVLAGELVERETTADILPGSMFCLTDSRHRQPTLGHFLAHASIAAELGALHAKVVIPAWLGTPVLLVGPTAAGYYDLWSIAWRRGGWEPSTVTLNAVDD